MKSLTIMYAQSHKKNYVYVTRPLFFCSGRDIKNYPLEDERITGGCFTILNPENLAEIEELCYTKPKHVLTQAMPHVSKYIKNQAAKRHGLIDFRSEDGDDICCNEVVYGLAHMTEEIFRREYQGDAKKIKKQIVRNFQRSTL